MATATPQTKMAASEKQRRPSPTTAAAATANGDPENEPPGFLLQSGASGLLRGALLRLLEVRPEDPVAFLADYFERRAEASAVDQDGSPDGDPAPRQGRLRRALWHLSLARRARRTAFNNNIILAYDSLSAGGKQKKPGVNGRLYSELLQLLCQEGGIPDEIVGQLLHKVTCRDHEAVPFDIFRFGALTCLVLSEFLAKADTLYDVLAGDSGKADKRVCLAVLCALEEALHTTDASTPARYLQAGSKLTPDCLSLAMDKALSEKKASVAMKKEEFLKRASSIFVSRVKVFQ